MIDDEKAQLLYVGRDLANVGNVTPFAVKPLSYRGRHRPPRVSSFSLLFSPVCFQRVMRADSFVGMKTIHLFYWVQACHWTFAVGDLHTHRHLEQIHLNKRFGGDIISGGFLPLGCLPNSKAAHI